MATMEEDRSDTELDNESDIDVDLDEEAEDSSSDDEVEVVVTESDGSTTDWTTDGSDIPILNFDEQPGPRHSLSPSACPLDFFHLMFPMALLEILVLETNRYAAQCMETAPNTTWHDTYVEEMRAFLAIQIMFGIRQLPRLWMYWSQDKRFNDPWVSAIMTINRFKNISRYFHCRDTTKTPARGEAGHDPLYKIRNIIDTTERTFRKYFQPHRELSIDESMLAFKGRLAFKQYMPKKPIKHGIKLWTICDAKLGYCLGYRVYTGKSSRTSPDKPLGFEVVDTLSAHVHGKGHHIYVDRFFHSVEVATHLLLNGTYIIGTIMGNRKGLPAMAKRKLKKKGDLAQAQKGNLLTTAYHDKQTVLLLSTNQVMGTDDDGRPWPLVDYNKFMGGVDLFDQQISYYPVSRPGKKWWRYIVWHTIGAAIFNAFLLWRESEHDYDVLKGYDHMMFRADIAEALLNGFSSRKLPGRKATKVEPIQPESIKQHVIDKIEGRKRQCVLCSMNSKKTPKGYPVETSFYCKFCGVSLCRKVCFGKYHELAMASANGQERE